MGCPLIDVQVLDATVFADHGLEDDFSLDVSGDRNGRICRFDLVNQKAFGNAAGNRHGFRWATDRRMCEWTDAVEQAAHEVLLEAAVLS